MSECYGRSQMLTQEMISPADPMESFPHTASSLQSAPATSSLATACTAGSSLPRDAPSANAVTPEESGSESELLSLPDYLILSNCETGRPRHTRYAHLPNVRRFLWWALSWTCAPHA